MKKNYTNVHHITAGAGAGKTTELVNIITRLVSEGYDPKRMILTTYTDAAATELREKSKAKLSPADAVRMNGAQMGTLHSVASRYINRYWYLLGISPSVKPVSESVSKILMNRSLDELVSGEQKALLNKYVETFGIVSFDDGGYDYDFWKKTLMTLFDKMRGYGFGKEKIPEIRKQTMDLLQDTFNQNQNQAVFDSCEPCLNKYLGYGALVGTHVTAAGQKQYAENCKQVNMILAIDPHKVGKRQLKEIKEMKWGREHTISKEPAKSLYEADINACKKAVADAAVRLGEDLVPVEYSMILDIAGLLFDIMEAWMDDYEKIKKEAGVIDFADMEKLFRILLDKQEVREDILASVDFLFVDEFQDSTPIQADIYAVLSELIQQSWFVGDRKQAIYGFAGSDSGLIAELVDSFPDPEKDSSSISGYKKDGNGNSSQVLDISRRSVPRLVKAANDIFIPAFGTSPGAAKDVIPQEFVELKPWDEKKDTAWDPLYHVVASKTVQGKTYLSADALANFVCSISESSGFKEAGYSLSDIAILTRSGSQAIKIGKALVKRGIRTGFVDPVGFRDTPEVSLVLAVLRLSEGIDRDKSRAEIRKLLLDEDLKTLSSKVGKKANDLTDFPSVEDFAKALRPHSVPDRIKEIITRFDLQGICGQWGNPDARRGSLNLLCKASEEYAAKSAILCCEADVRGFLGFLKDYKTNERFDNSAEGVKVLTYHKSKGLDWKIVILCGLDEYKEENTIGGVSVLGSSMNPEGILAIPRLPDEKWVLDSIQANKESKETLDQRRAVKLGEEKRLLYVGFTRAKEVVITAAKSTSPEVLKTLCPTVQARVNSNPVGDTVDIWGLPDGVVSRYKDCSNDPDLIATGVLAPERYKDAGFLLPACPAPKHTKYHSPSTYRDPAVQAAASPAWVDSVGNRMVISHNLEDNVFGDCIHHIFARCAPGKHEANLAVAESTLKGYGITDAEAPGKVVSSIESFFKWMEARFPMTRLGQEVPFRYTDQEGRVFSGSMDLVWGTEKGCVLVDFKTFPGAVSDLFNNNSEHWAGKYASQLSIYADALSSSEWKTPEDRLLFYPVEGLIIRV